MTRFIYFLSLISALVLAGEPQVTRGDALKRREYQTYAAVTLYVDPTGSDSNACTASGTSACLTLQGALNKLPRFIRNNVTVNVAAGTYVGNWQAVFTMEVGASAAIPSFNVTGPSMSTFTPATGSATGTLTSVSQQAVPLSTLADTGQSWTVNDLRGRFIRFTSGSGSTKLIIANTATTITYLSANSTAPVVGNTYIIETPAAVLSGAGRVELNTFSATVTMSNLDLSSSSGAALTVRGLSRPLFSNSRILSSSVSAGITSNSVPPSTSGGGTLYVANTSTGVALSVGAVSYPASWGSTSGIYAYSAASTAIAFSAVSGSWISMNLVAETGSTSAVPLVVSGVPASSSGGAGTGVIAVRCPAGHTNYGAQINATLEFQNFVSENCGTALSVGSYISSLGALTPSYVYIRSNSAVSNATTALEVRQGGRIYIPTSPTFTTVTNELSLDGTFFTYADLSAASPSVITNSYGSSISR